MPLTESEPINESIRPAHWSNEILWMRQFEYFRYLYDQIRDIPGDIVECGVGEGGTFLMLTYLAGTENLAPARVLWGFDSFEGWPEPSPYDESPRHPKKGEWAIEETIVRTRLEKNKVTDFLSNLDLRLVKGFLDQTLPNFPKDRQIAFLHLDVDLYEGYRDGLVYLFPLVSPGGIVALDEYNERPNREAYEYGQMEKWPGCTKAVDEYFANRPEKPQFYPRAGKSGKYYVVKAEIQSP